MAEKNGNTITWSKLGVGLAALVIGLVVFIWTTTIPPAAVTVFDRIGKTDSAQTARIVWLENQRAQDSVARDRQTALLIDLTQLLKDRLPQVGPNR